MSIMGSETGVNAAGDSDGSVTWEDFFGTSTDLVPQLLGMFDELARKGDGSNGEQQQQQQQQHQQHQQQHIPAAIQKRLSLVAAHSQRNSIFGHICTSNNSMQSQQQPQSQDQTTMLPRLDETNSKRTMCSHVEITVCNTERENENENTIVHQDCNNDDDKSIYRCKMTGGGLMPEYNNRRRKHLDRPLSGSSIASSTSSSGCSNQGNACSANPYLASVESLADTCASSQGSGDSGVVTTSETICRIRDNVNQRRNSIVDNSSPLICHRARYCDSQRNPVERVLLEIVDTEAIYVEHLRQVIQGYLIFWRDDPAGLLQQLQLIHLFSNIEDIFRFNREFLKEIEACGLNPVMVANTFTKHNAGFKVYTEYCTNYPRTVSVLTDLMGRNDTAKAFRERQAALGHALPLGSFLLKPVQRILKYHLLLENLSKEYEADETQLNMQEGKNAIEEALATMTGIAKHINAMKRRHEHAVRVQEIQSLLYGWPGPDLTTSGELVAEGRFRMRGAKAPRHAFLFERMLLLTKKKEDGLLVYKAHIMCSNLMLIESIPGEPCSFHVIPFDNPRLQYTLQARNLEQKREWTLQIKRVMLENYNAVIPSHARQLVLQLGQTHHDDETTSDRGSMKKQYSSPPEYLERRKQEKERRRSEAGLRQKAKKSNGKNDNSTSVTSTTVENSPATSRKNPSGEDQSGSSNSNRDRSLNRSFDGRALKVKDRFTNWRRKSEPGFQSYVSLNQSDDELNDNNNLVIDSPSPVTQIEVTNIDSINDIDTSQTHNTNVNSTTINSSTVTNTKDVNEQQTHVRTVEEIVGHILMQNQEFQRLLEKQRNNSLANVRQQQRFKKHQRSIDTSDDSDIGEQNYSSELLNSSNNSNIINNSRINRSTRIARREHRLVRTNNAWNSLSSVQSRDNNTNLQLQYNNLRTENEKAPIADVNSKNKVNHRVYEKRAMFEAFKRQSIVTESKIIKTALRIREHSINDEINDNNTNINDNIVTSTRDVVNIDEKQNETIVNQDNSDATGFGNYDNLQHVWDGLTSDNRHNEKSDDSPTRPAVWLTKLCDDLPTSPQKSGSLPRSFQISPNPQEAITKARFLQRDGKPMSERPFTIASDKPAEINLEDMERYASSYQPKGRIAKFPISASSTSSTFFYSLDDNLTDIDSDVQTSTATTTAITTPITMSATTVTGNNIHPDHKIYRANISGSTMLKNVLSKAGSRLQGLRSTVSAETLECADDFSRSTSYSRFYGDMKIKKKKNKLRLSRESSTDIDEPAHVGCIPAANSSLQIPSLYYKQGSSGLGARIAQADYADPSVLFFDTKRSELNLNESITSQSSAKSQMVKEENDECDEKRDRIGSDGDGYYEKCFETIENYIDTEADDTFRDSAIFSDAEEIISAPQIISTTASTTSTTTTATSLDVNESNIPSRIKVKIAPPVPIKRKPKIISNNLLLLNEHKDDNTNKPSVALKPIDYKSRPKLVRGKTEFITSRSLTVAAVPHEEITKSNLSATDEQMNISNNFMLDDRNDVSAGQSQAGWVKKMVGQLQAQIET
ncbi:hypothetical protein PV328_007044 [Microctonus aethiopoides]|uniref:Pleckstrin homology domain-containing family G member 1 n=2 Tax=Microctonus aethiopoides TaxID=144406 RepID=A0AA39KU86_9HYME|nr:hypothetical protein PV328_007044 [Microctonus aethiopoides]